MKHENLGLGMLVGGAVGLSFGVGVCFLWLVVLPDGESACLGVSAEVG